MIFVNSMSDLFHKDIPKSFIDHVFETMENADWHIFQVLTKRSSLLKKYVNQRYKLGPCPKHIWLGVSVEDSMAKSRISHLRDTNATTRFLSVEPLIADVGSLNLEGIHWVIVGGESGARARPMQLAWVTSIMEQCKTAAVPFFFKQWGRFGSDGRARSKKANGRELLGSTYDELPV